MFDAGLRLISTKSDSRTIVCDSWVLDSLETTLLIRLTDQDCAKSDLSILLCGL